MSKNILLGITGSVAASKSEILYKNLSIDNNVKIICTDAGLLYLSDDFIKNVSFVAKIDWFGCGFVCSSSSQASTKSSKL